MHLPLLEPRLRCCYLNLLRQLQRGGQSAQSTIRDGRPAADAATATASFAQKLWRFTHNSRVTYPALLDPLLRSAREFTNARPDRVQLVVHDWCTLAFPNHTAKPDRKTLSHDRDVGYDLHPALLVDATTGSPVAPLDVTLTTANAALSTRPQPIPDQPAAHVDQLLPAMKHIDRLGLPAKLVHVIDREADSVGHWRAWDPDHVVLVRADDRHVRRGGQPTKLSEIHAGFRAEQRFEPVGLVKHHGVEARQFVAETRVVLHRPAKRKVRGKSVEMPGRPVELRFVMTEVRNGDGDVLATWWLLTNAPAAWGDAAEVARWYYFRWRIESTFKLLKSAGWDVEDWLQRKGEALFRKLLLVIANCVQVWQLELRQDASSEWFKEILMRLSGRQVKRSVPVTTSGLLAGLWVWLAVRAVKEDHDEATIEDLLAKHLPLYAENAVPPPTPRKRKKDV